MTPGQWALLLLGALALSAGLALWWHARRLWAQSGLPSGEVVFEDMGAWQPGETLRSEVYGLVGRPDYVVRAGRRLWPVEVKPRRGATEPYAADILQLGAYCLLVKESTGQDPPAGLLRYRDTTFRIPYGRTFKERVLATLEQMRADAQCADVPRSHHDPSRCQFCGVRGHCGQRL